MTRPLISCIVPVYNGEQFVGEAIDSILTQTYSPLEVIVVDDGSTDGTAAVVCSFGDRIMYVAQPNAGKSAARNRGISLAGGDLIALLDADDVWLPEKLSRQYEEFARRPDLDICGSHMINFWVEELQEEEQRFRDHRISEPLPWFGASTLVARRQVFDRVGLFDPARSHSETTELLLRAQRAGCSAELLPDVLCRRRLHHRNESRLEHQEHRDSFLDVLKLHLDHERGKK